MQDTSGSRRRVPPRGNPDEPAPTQSSVRQQVTGVPWVAIALTSAVTTFAGYLTLQLIGAARDALKRRRAEAADDAAFENPPVAVAPAPGYYGARPDGSFRLPGPHDMEAVQTPISTGFGRPLRYQGDDARALDQRLARIEQALLAQQGAPHQGSPYQPHPGPVGPGHGAPPPYRGEVH